MCAARSRLAFMADLSVHADMLKNEFGEPLQREEAGAFTEEHLFWATVLQRFLVFLEKN